MAQGWSQVYFVDRRCGCQLYLRQMASWKTPLWRSKPCSSIGPIKRLPSPSVYIELYQRHHVPHCACMQLCVCVCVMSAWFMPSLNCSADINKEKGEKEIIAFIQSPVYHWLTSLVNAYRRSRESTVCSLLLCLLHVFVLYCTQPLLCWILYSF